MLPLYGAIIMNLYSNAIFLVTFIWIPHRTHPIYKYINTLRVIVFSNDCIYLPILRSEREMKDKIPVIIDREGSYEKFFRITRSYF